MALRANLWILARVCILLSVHCFNDYGKNKGKNCTNFEVSYLIECEKQMNLTPIAHPRNRRDLPIICEPEKTRYPRKGPTNTTATSTSLVINVTSPVTTTSTDPVTTERPSITLLEICQARDPRTGLD